MAIYSTSCLRGNANRLPSLARHEHRFHRSRPRQFLLAAWEPEQITHRTIGRCESLLHLRQDDPRFFGQPLAQGRWQIRNLSYIKFSFRVQRMINLRPTKRRLTERHAEFPQLFFRFPQQFHAVLSAANHLAVSPPGSSYRLTLFPVPLPRYLITSLSNNAIILWQSPLPQDCFVARLSGARESEAPYDSKYCSRTTYHYGLGKRPRRDARARIHAPKCSRLRRATRRPSSDSREILLLFSRLLHSQSDFPE